MSSHPRAKRSPRRSRLTRWGDWRQASADAARCSDRNLHTHPVARCPGPPRNQRALLLGTERRRTRRGPGHSTHRIGRRGAHSPEATKADRAGDGTDQQQSFQHVKPCLLSLTSRLLHLSVEPPRWLLLPRQGFGSIGSRFDLDGEAVRPRDGSAYITKSACETARWESGVSLCFVCWSEVVCGVLPALGAAKTPRIARSSLR
jgi:hypothetical protein